MVRKVRFSFGLRVFKNCYVVCDIELFIRGEDVLSEFPGFTLTVERY